MNESNQGYGGQGQDFGKYFILVEADDANIDPVLNTYTSGGGPRPPDVSDPVNAQLFMGSAMWNPKLNDVNLYPSGMSSMAPISSTNSPKQPIEMQSPPLSLSSEPLSQSSRTSSKSSIPSTADTDTKLRRSNEGSKAQTQRQQTSAAPISHLSHRRKYVKEPTLNEEEEHDGADDIGLDKDARRTKFLKRNRIAASKCRQKKKEWAKNLEDTRCSLKNKNIALHKQHSSLVNELITIKNQLMLHTSCNDANIDQWLDNEARRYIQRIAEQDQALTQSQPHRDSEGCCSNNRQRSSGRSFNPNPFKQSTVTN
jgi:hypothetical protein